MRGVEELIWASDYCRLVRLYRPRKGTAAVMALAAPDEPSLEPIHRRAKRRGFTSLRFVYDDLTHGDPAEDLKAALNFWRQEVGGLIEVHAIGTSARIAISAVMSLTGQVDRIRLSLMAPRLLERFSPESLKLLRQRGVRSTFYIVDRDAFTNRRAILDVAAALDARVFGLEETVYEKLPSKIVSAPRLPRLA